VRALLERTLTKDPHARWRDIGDVRIDLATIARDPTGARSAAVPIETTAWQRWIPWAVAGVMAAGLVWLFASGQIAGRVPAPGGTPATLEIVLPPGMHLAVNTEHPTIALSPDGSQLVFVGVQDGTRRLYRRAVADPTFGVVEIERTEGAASPFFSPDGTAVAFFDTPFGLKVVSTDSGVPTDVAYTTGPIVNRGGAWLDDRTFVYTSSANKPVSVAEWVPGQESLPADAWSAISGLPAPSSWPHPFPGGRDLLFTDQSNSSDNASVAAFSLETSRTMPLVNGGTNRRPSRAIRAGAAPSRNAAHGCVD
jgi:hypothetical protein